jgi:hypothetical protein
MCGVFTNGNLRLWDHDQQVDVNCPPGAFMPLFDGQSCLPPVWKATNNLNPDVRLPMLERWLGVRLVDNELHLESTLVGFSKHGETVLSCPSVKVGLPEFETVCGRCLKPGETGYTLDYNHDRLLRLRIDVIGCPVVETEEDDTIKWARKLHAERGYSVGKSAARFADQSGGSCSSHY